MLRCWNRRQPSVCRSTCRRIERLRILLLGANGQLGATLRRRLTSVGAIVCATRDGYLTTGATCEVADLAQPASLAALVARVKPDVVVNAAAYTAVDRAEDEAQAAWMINAKAPAALAAACAASSAALVHYSTDYVFDGTERSPYREDQPAAPLNQYGASKLAGEDAIRNSGARHLILRTAGVYGLDGRNFLTKMLHAARSQQVLRVVDDQIGGPTPAVVVAEATAQILATGLPTLGIGHLVVNGQVSWYDFASELFAQARVHGWLERAPELQPIPTSLWPTRARRPAYSVLDNSRLQHSYGLILPQWREALTEVLASRRPDDSHWT